MKKAIVAVIALLVSLPAHASVLISIERVSDTQAILTASGSLDVAAPGTNNDHVLVLDDPFLLDPISDVTDSIFSSSTMTVGAQSITFAFSAGSDFDRAETGNATAYFGSSTGQLSTGATLSGNMLLTLTGPATWASIGSTGTVFWGVNNNAGNSSVAVGRWIVSNAVPAPAALGLLGLGLAGLGFAGLRRKA